jgi:hypothetical protein
MTGKDLIMVPFDGEPLYWSTNLMVREGRTGNNDVECFGNHVLKWMEAIQKKQILR